MKGLYSGELDESGTGLTRMCSRCCHGHDLHYTEESRFTASEMGGKIRVRYISNQLDFCFSNLAVSTSLK